MSSNKAHFLSPFDGNDQTADYFENMWDLTPDPELLKELPEDYSFETALADLIDNSLQSVWSNGEGERKLISIVVNEDTISVFDTGPGMDASEENSIVKWGKVDASLQRASERQAIGGKPPYLTPCFGMYGYGGTYASMHLGRNAVVSTKTTNSKKVYWLQLDRDALVKQSGSSSNNYWKAPGGIRDSSVDEMEMSPHGSFTKVEMKPKEKLPDIYRLQCRLKDIYFPYIQCDEISEGKTATPVEFQVNSISLAEVEGGEVAITNLHSCNGPEFEVSIHFTLEDSSDARVSREANARLKCVYFPHNEGKENIERILDKLKADGSAIKDDFGTFSRISIRWLGRLLPDARWELLPFMRPKRKRGEKDQVLRRCSRRVKCFIDTDAGFNPIPSKTDLAPNNPFSKALKDLGGVGGLKEVKVDIYRGGKQLAFSQLEKEYQDWMMEMHARYDEEFERGNDEAVLLVNEPNKESLGIMSDDKMGETYTFRALEFVNLPRSTQQLYEAQTSEIIIGVVDTKFDNSFECFSDEGFTPLKKEWNGTDEGFPCNSKVVGFRKFKTKVTEYNAEHGSVCCTIAAGDYEYIDFFGIRRGEHGGCVPKSRLALYECSRLAIDMCDAIIAATIDGVDVISASIGPMQKDLERMRKQREGTGCFVMYALSYGTLVAAMKNVVSVVCAGNKTEMWYGSHDIVNYAPWECGTGACSTDMEFNTKIRLGDNQIFKGTSTNVFKTKGLCPLILEENGYGTPEQDCDSEPATSDSKSTGNFSRDKVKDKIVLATKKLGIRALAVKGAAGVIILSSEEDPLSRTTFPLPGASVLREEYEKIKMYIQSDEDAKAEILPTVEERLDDGRYPVLLTCSLRGPSPVAPDLMKPEICALGEILVPTKSKNTVLETDDGRVSTPFRVAVGTSISTPIVAGLVAHFRSVHPTLSATAIRSAFMITASPMATRCDADVGGIGCGVINLEEACSTLVVYHIDPKNYLRFLKHERFIFETSIIHGSRYREILEEIVEMYEGVEKLHLRDLNFPYFVASFVGDEEHEYTFTRTLKYVGDCVRTLSCHIQGIEGLEMSVYPEVLSFQTQGEEKNFYLKVKVIDWDKAKSFGFRTYLEWRFENFKARSYIMINKRST